MKTYIGPKSMVMKGEDIGFALLDRITTLFLKNAQKIDWHEHAEIEILCCIKGSLTYEFRKRAPTTLTTGCFMVIPAGLEHRLVGGIDGPCRRLSFFIRERHIGRKNPSPLSTAEMRELLALLLKKRLRPHVIKETALQQISRLATLICGSRPLALIDQLTARSDALAAILTLAATRRDSTFKTETRLMDDAVEWLEKHYAEQITLDQLITYMGYGRARFFTLFKTHTGQSPIDWLIQFRINKAKVLLSTTRSSVISIAKSCGFADPAFFARAFRRRTGTPPNEFRKLATRF